MKIGVSSMFFGDMTLEAFLDTLRKHEWIDVVDIWYDTPFYLLASDADRAGATATIRAYKESHGVDTVSHLASIDINPVCYNPAVQELALREAFKSVDFAASIGSSLVVLHGGFSSFGSPTTPYDVKLLVSFAGRVIRYIEEKNLSVRVCVENDASTPNAIRPLEHVDVAEKLLDTHSDLHVVVDLAHVLKSSSTPVNMVSQVGKRKFDLENFGPFIERHASRICMIHASTPDVQRTHGRMDLARDSTSKGLVHHLATCLDLDNVPVVFEYAMETFGGHDEALRCIHSDAIAFSQLVDRT